jgi:actin-related protein 5
MLATSTEPGPSRPKKQIYRIDEVHAVVENPPFSTDYERFAGTQTPIVIDNGNDYPFSPPPAQTTEHTMLCQGSSELRAGWATESSPRLACENITARFRERKAQRPILLAGGEVYVDATSRANTKAPYDGDVVCNFDAMVSLSLVSL